MVNPLCGAFQLTLDQIIELPDLDKHLYVYNFPSERGVRFNRRRLIYGVGENDADYVVGPTVCGVKVVCPAYQTWRSMLTRAFCPKYRVRRPTYCGTEVDPAWFKFSGFLDWWLDHQVDGWQLDKDLVGNGKLYSQSTCIFVPNWLNSFTGMTRGGSGKLPIGVYMNGKRYGAQSSNGLGENTHLGYFDTPDQAHDCWREERLSQAFGRKDEMDEIDVRIYPRVVEMMWRAPIAA